MRGPPRTRRRGRRGCGSRRTDRTWATSGNGDVAVDSRCEHRQRPPRAWHRTAGVGVTGTAQSRETRIADVTATQSPQTEQPKTASDAGARPYRTVNPYTGETEQEFPFLDGAE